MSRKVLPLSTAANEMSLKMTLIESVLRGGVLGAVVGAYLARNCATQMCRRGNGSMGYGVRREMEDGGRV